MKKGLEDINIDLVLEMVLAVHVIYDSSFEIIKSEAKVLRIHRDFFQMHF